MSTDHFLKIPSLLQFNSSSPIQNEVNVKKEEYDEESPKMDTEDIGINIDSPEVRKPSISLVIPNISFVSNLLKPTASPMAKSEDTRPLKKMLTKEEMEAETKIATQRAMIQLGEQIAEKRFTEKMEKERREKIEKIFEELVLDQEYMEKKDIEDWIEENEGKLKEWGFQKRMEGKELFAKLLFAYSYQKIDLEKQQNEIKELKNTIQENDEQMEQYIEEIEDKERIVESKDQTIKLQENSIIRLNLRINEEFKRDYYIYFMILFVSSHILSITIQRYGILNHILIILKIGDLILDMGECFWNIGHIVLKKILETTMRSETMYSFVLLMACIQMIHIGKIGYQIVKTHFGQKWDLIKKKKRD